MSIKQLTPEDQAVIRRCLEHVLSTPALDVDFETRLGVSRSEVSAALMRWPRINDERDDSPAAIAVSSALNEVANGLPLGEREWGLLRTTRTEVQRVVARWTLSRGRSLPGPGGGAPAI